MSNDSLLAAVANHVANHSKSQNTKETVVNGKDNTVRAFC